MALWHFETLYAIALIKKQRYEFLAPLELTLWWVTGNPYGAKGDLALYVYLTKEFQFQISVLAHVLVLFLVLVRILVLLLFLVRILVLLHVFVLVCVLVRIFVRVLVRVLVKIKYGAMNVSVRHGSYIVDCQRSYEVAQKLKGLSHESVWIKSVEKSRCLFL